MKYEVEIPTPQENPIGLHSRYVVSKSDGSKPDPDAVYFVLRIDGGGKDKLHVEACRVAALAYADSVTSGSTPHLAQIGVDLRKLIESMETQESATF